MRIFPLIVLCSAFASSLAWAQEEPGGTSDKTSERPPPDGVTVMHDVEIGTGGGRPLHAEIAFPTVTPKDPMPAVLWIHGGGWSKGTHKKNPGLWLAAKGYFVASIEYRLSDEAKWPAQLEDSKLAVRWLRANAAKYHVDPNRIAAWGASAGGHLVTCLGTMDDPKYEGAGGYPGVSSKVQVVIDFCGPVDFNQGSAGIQRPIAKAPDYESPGLLGLFGASFKEKPDLWKEGSPINYVKKGDPPFLIVSGDKDLSVPHEQAVKLDEVLEKSGVVHELITVKGGGHGMHEAKGDPPASPNSKEIQAAVLAFLEKHMGK